MRQNIYLIKILHFNMGCGVNGRKGVNGDEIITNEVKGYPIHYRNDHLWLCGSLGGGLEVLWNE